MRSVFNLGNLSWFALDSKFLESGHASGELPQAHQRRSAGGPRPQHVARSRWSGTFLSLSTSYAAADRDGPRSGGGGFKMRREFISACIVSLR